MHAEPSPAGKADGAAARPPPGIVHVDMDAFFVSVELRRRPWLRGRPVMVGGSGDRGVVAAASYEARAYGIHSAMPSVQARRRCPHAVFLPGDHEHYRQVSDRVMAIFRSFTPWVEPLSLDEAFLDVGGSSRLLGAPDDIAHRIRRRVHAEEGLTCSVGVAPNKMLAKLASQAAKPRAARSGPIAGAGVVTVRPGEELGFLHPLPVASLWGVGPATRERLDRLGVRTVGDLAQLPRDVLRRALGTAAGTHLHDLALGRDERPVVVDQHPRSVGHEQTYAVDRRDRPAVDRELVRLADAVASRLRRLGVAGRTVVLKVRFSDYRTITRSVTLPEPTDSGAVIAGQVKSLAGDIELQPGIRLLGVSVTGLGADAAHQLSLLGATASDWSEVDRTVDLIRDRFGVAAIGPAVLASGRGLQAGPAQNRMWGPEHDDAGDGAPGG